MQGICHACDTRTVESSAIFCLCRFHKCLKYKISECQCQHTPIYNAVKKCWAISGWPLETWTPIKIPEQIVGGLVRGKGSRSTPCHWMYSWSIVQYFFLQQIDMKACFLNVESFKAPTQWKEIIIFWKYVTYTCTDILNSGTRGLLISEAQGLISLSDPVFS